MLGIHHVFRLPQATIPSFQASVIPHHWKTGGFRRISVYFGGIFFNEIQVVDRGFKWCSGTGYQVRFSRRLGVGNLGPSQVLRFILHVSNRIQNDLSFLLIGNIPLEELFIGVIIFPRQLKLL